MVVTSSWRSVRRVASMGTSGSSECRARRREREGQRHQQPSGQRPRRLARDVHSNTLRHSTASSLLAAGTHTEVVQEHLGHSSYAITADIYSHVGPAQQREAADRLDEALRW